MATLSGECISKCLSRLDPKDYLSIYPHSAVPCHNLHTDLQNEEDVTDEAGQFITNFFEPFPYSVSYPIPVFQPTAVGHAVVNSVDPALNLVKEKKNWEGYKAQLLKHCSVKQAEKLKDLKKKKTRKISLNIVMLANHLSRDPDGYFNANYNTYYTGGNITTTEVGDTKYLIRTRDSELLCSPFVSDDNTLEVQDQVSYSSNTNLPGPIYQVVSNRNMVLARQKYAVSLFSLSEPILDKCFTIESDIPVVSSTISTDDSFCNLTADRGFEIIDISSSKLVLKGKQSGDEEMLPSDCWASAHYVDHNTLIFADRASLSLIDLRTNGDIVKQWVMDSLTEVCEMITATSRGCLSLLYVVTAHQMLCLDLRHGFCQRWTHSISHSPSLVALPSPSCTRKDSVFIGSQRSDSVVLIENQWEGDRSRSRVHPYELPSLRETLHLARYNGFCLGNIAASRLAMCTTGLCSVEDDAGITLFRQTSVGDVFKQRLTKSEAPKNDFFLAPDELMVLEEWENTCEEMYTDENYPCVVTAIHQEDYLLEYLRSIKEDFSLIESPKKEKKKKILPWNISKSELSTYQDYLAPRLLEAWNLDDMEEWGVESGTCDGRSEEAEDSEEDLEDAIAERVVKWVENYSQDNFANPDDPEEKEVFFPSTKMEEEKFETDLCIENFIKEKKEELNILEERKPKIVDRSLRRNVNIPKVKKPMVTRSKKEYVAGF